MNEHVEKPFHSNQILVQDVTQLLALTTEILKTKQNTQQVKWI